MNLLSFTANIVISALSMLAMSFVIGVYLSDILGLTGFNLSEKTLVGATTIFHYTIILYIVNYYTIRLSGLTLSMVALLSLLLISIYALTRSWSSIKTHLSSINNGFLRLDSDAGYIKFVLMVILALVSTFILFNYYANNYDFYDYYHYVASNYNIVHGLLHNETILFNTITVMFDGVYYDIINPRALALYMFILYVLSLHGIVRNISNGGTVFVLTFLLLPNILVLFMYESLYLESVFIIVLMLVLWSILRTNTRLIIFTSPLLLFTKGYGVLMFMSLSIILLYIYFKRRVDKTAVLVSSVAPILSFVILSGTGCSPPCFFESMELFVIVTLFLGAILWMIDIDHHDIRIKSFASTRVDKKLLLWLLPLIFYLIYFVLNILFHNALNFEVNYGLLRKIVSLNLTKIAAGSIGGGISIQGIIDNTVRGIFNGLTLPYVFFISLWFSVFQQRRKDRGIGFAEAIILSLLYNYIYVFVLKFDGTWQSINYRYTIPLSLLLALLFYLYISKQGSMIPRIVTVSLLASVSLLMFYVSLARIVFDKRSVIMILQETPLFSAISVSVLLLFLFSIFAGRIGLFKAVYTILIWVSLAAFVASIFLNVFVLSRPLGQGIGPDDPHFSSYIYEDPRIKQYYYMYIDYARMINIIETKYDIDGNVVLTINIPLTGINPSTYLKTSGNIYVEYLYKHPDRITCILMPKDNCPEETYVLKRNVLIENTFLKRIEEHGNTVASTRYFYLKCLRANS